MTDSHKHDDMPGGAIAAVFDSREEAKRAIGALHKAHFKKTWFGTTSTAVANSGDETLTAEGQGGGFFSQDARPLVDALIAADVDGDTARRIEREAVPGCAIVTVRPPDDDKVDPSTAVEILSRYGGRVDGRTAVGAGSLGSRSTYEPVGADEGLDDSMEWSEETFYRRS